MKKAVAIALTASTVLWAGGMAIPGSASAQSVADLQAQIAALLAQINALQAQLGPASGSSASSYNFTRDLTLGSKGDEVKALQQMLNAKGYQVSASGAGSPGNESTYFGPATKAALAKWQAANGISPAVGYFGPKTRAAVNAMSSTGTGTGTGTGPGTGPGTGTGPSTGTTVVVPAGVDLWVAAAADNPGASTVAGGTAFNPGVKLQISAGAKDVSVTQIRVKKTGYISNTTVTGIDIIDAQGLRHGNVITSISADNDALILFPNDPIVVKANTSTSVLVRFNLGSVPGSATVQLGVESAAAVGAGSAVVSGSFPVWGAIMNVVSGANAIASTTVDVRPVNASGVTLNVDPQNWQNVTKFRVQETSSKEGLCVKKITLYNVGNAGANDFKEVRIKSQEGNVLATANPVDKWVVLDLSANSSSSCPYFIDKGMTKDFEVDAKFVDGTTRTVQLAIFNDYDLVMMGKDTGVNLLPGAGSTDTSFPIGDASNYNKVTIGTGSLTFKRATESPTTAVTPGATNVVLGIFDARPTGEQMELRQLSFGVGSPGPATTSLTGTIYVRVNGAVVYSTAASNFTSSTQTVTLSTYPTLTSGVDNKISVEVSVSSNAVSSDSYFVNDMDIVQVKRLVSNDLVDPAVATVDSNTINVQAADLDAVTLSVPADGSVVAGTNNYELARFQFVAANGGEDVKLKALTVTDSLQGGNTAYGGVTNLLMYKEDGTPLTTSASTATNANTVTFTFSNPLVITRSTPVTLLLKGDMVTVSSSTQHRYRVASTSNLDAVGYTTGNTLSGSALSVTGPGQTQTIVSSGSTTVSLVSGSGAAPSQDQIVNVGTTDGTYFAVKISAQYEAQKLTSLTLKATSSSATTLATSTIQNIRLYRQVGNGAIESTPFTSVGEFTSCASGECSYTFSASDNLLPAAIQPASPVTIYVKANIGASGSVNLGDDFKFVIASGGVATKGAITGSSASVAGTATTQGRTYVTPFSVVATGDYPTSAVTVGTGSGAILGRFKVTNNGSAAIVLTTSTIALSGTVTSTQQYALYASVEGGSANDASITYGTSSLTSGNLFGDLTALVASTTNANRTISGNTFRYLTVKTLAVAANNDSVALSINAVGNIRYQVAESDLGYSGNAGTGDSDFNDTISNLFVDGKPSLSSVTMKN